MRIVYTLPIKSDVIIEDHWPVPFMDGLLRIVSTSKKATSIEITFENQSTDYAPKFTQFSEGEVAGEISGRDDRIQFIRIHLEDALSYIRCFFDIEVELDHIKIDYMAESDIEKSLIPISSFKRKKQETPLILPFNILTRALMASEVTSGPRFVSTLARTARQSFIISEYINSFRYSFLLIESLYGDGQFKKASLIDAFNKSPEFTRLISVASNSFHFENGTDASLSAVIKQGSKSLIAYLVEKRGLYFHGNVKRKDAWKPNQQEGAKDLAAFALDIVQLIGYEAAEPMFDKQHDHKHFENAIKVGAEIVYKITMKYNTEGRGIDDEYELKIRAPGMRVTSEMAIDIVQQSLSAFRNNRPASRLINASCIVDGTNEKVFEINFFLKRET